MKTISKKVRVSSLQIADEFVTKFNVNRAIAKYSVLLGEIPVTIPESIDDVIALLNTTPVAVIGALKRQLVTDAANKFRKQHEKTGDLLEPKREQVRRWLFTPEGMPFATEYMALPLDDKKAVNAWLDEKYAEHLDEDE